MRELSRVAGASRLSAPGGYLQRATTTPPPIHRDLGWQQRGLPGAGIVGLDLQLRGQGSGELAEDGFPGTLHLREAAAGGSIRTLA